MPVTIVARTTRGLEWVAADEVAATIAGAQGMAMAAREVTFGLPRLEPGLLGLRTVDDVFLDVGGVQGVGHTRESPAVLARRIAALDWAGALRELRSLRAAEAGSPFDVVASLEGRHNYNRFAVEDAVGGAVQAVMGAPYLPRTSDGRHPGQPSLSVRVFIRGAEARVALRLAPAPLHRREYKQEAGPGSLHPPVAAALVRLAHPVGDSMTSGTLADPFCGDGTIAIEAALADPAARVLAGDIDATRLDHCRHNATRAGARVLLARMDAGRLPWADRTADAVVTNPPWGVGVAAAGALRSSMEPLWSELARVLTPGRGRIGIVADEGLDVPALLARPGFHAGLATRIRLAGRVSHVVVGAPAGSGPVRLPSSLAEWRREAIRAGVVTESGF